MRQRPATPAAPPASAPTPTMVMDAVTETTTVLSQLPGTGPAAVRLPAHTSLAIDVAPLAARDDSGDTRPLPVVGMYERAYETAPAPDAAMPTAQWSWPTAPDDADATMDFSNLAEAAHPIGKPDEDELALYRAARQLMEPLPPGGEVDAAMSAADAIARRNDAWFADAERREERMQARLSYFHAWWTGISAASDAAELARREAAQQQRGIPASLDTLVARIAPRGEAERFRAELDAMLDAGKSVAA